MKKNIYEQAYELLLSGKNIIFVRTIRRSGSTPRNVGSMCIITEDEKIIGTIGGGLLEYRVQQQAKKLLKQGKSFIYRFQLSNEDLAKDGMICGGDVDLYLEPCFAANSETLKVFKAITQMIQNNQSGILATKIEDDISAKDTSARILVHEDGTTLGTIDGVNPEKITMDKDISYELISRKKEKTDLFVEKIILNPQVFLFGAGHVSMFVAQLAKTVGFSITIIDDRPEFANEEKFPQADEILVASFDKAFEQLNISQNSYILIITRGHLHDKTVLQKALETNAAYIGMIGSIKKRNIIYKDLLELGISKQALEKVYSPIGIDINAETPEEIAVSIVGELIKKRAPERQKKNLIL
jgi:xanthine dehydrogenase accessory factor